MEPVTEHTRKNKRFNARVLKRAAIIGSIVLLLGFSLSAFLSAYTNKIAGLIIEELIRMRSDGAYTIQYEELDYSFLKQTLTVRNLELSVDTTSEDFIGIINTGGEVAFSASVPLMYLDITDVWAIYFKKQLKIEGVRFDDPVLNLKSYREEEGIAWQSDAGSLYNVISEHLRVFRINDLEVKNGSFQFEKMRGGLRHYSIENISFRISNFLLDSESGRGGDKFFYTDDIDIEALNQRIYLKDSIHVLYFKKLVLSTTKSEITVDSLVVSENERTNPQNKQIDFYSLYVPSITIQNVDFKAAYNEELLNIGKLNIYLPTINISDFPRKPSSADTTKPSAAALILDYFSNIKIDSFALKNATFGYQFLSETRKQGFSLDSLNVEVTQFRLDSSSVISHRPLYYETLEFSVKDYQFALPDSIHIFSFTHLEGSTIRQNMSFEDLRIEPRTDVNLQKLLAKNSKNKTFDIHFPKAVFYDVEGQDFFNTDTLRIRKIEVKKPRVDFVEYPSLSFERDYSDSLIFNFFPLLEGFASAVYIGEGSFEEGDFSWFLQSAKLTPQYRVSQFNLRVHDIRIDSLTPGRKRLLSAENFDLFSEKVILQRESDDFLFFSDNVFYSGEQQRLNAENVEFTFFHNEDGGSNADAVKVKYLQCGGLNLNQVFSREKSRIRYVKIRQPEVSISGKARKNKNGQKKTLRTDLLGDTDIGLFSIEDGNFDIALGNNRHFSVRNVFFEFNDFRSNSKRKTRFTLDHYLLRFRDLAYTDSLQNRLEIARMNYSPTDSTTVLNGLKFISAAGRQQAKGSQYIHVPEAVIAHWRPLNLYFHNEISPDHIELNDAEISIVRPANKVKRRRTRAGDMIDKISATRLMINNGKLNYRKAMESGDSLFFRSDRIDLTVHRFAIDSTNVEEDIFSIENIETNLQQNLVTFHRSPDSVYIGSVVKERTGNSFDLYDLLYKKYTPVSNEEVFSGEVEKMQIVGFDFEKLNEKSLEMDALRLSRPAVTYNGRLVEGEADPRGLVFLEGLTPDSSTYRKIRIDAITVDSGTVDLVLKEDWHPQPVSLSDLGVRIRGFDTGNSGKILRSDDVTISFGGIRYDLPDSLNYIQTGRLTLSLSDSTLSLDGLSLIPKVDKYDYGDLVGTQTDYLKINSGPLSLRGIDFEKLLIEKAVTARRFEVNDLDIYAFRDKRIPIKEEIYKPLPQELLRGMDVLLNIDTAVLHNGHIRYDEFAEEAIKPGEVEFSNLNAKIANIYTDKALVSRHPKCVVQAEALMMNEGRLSATFRFDMLSPEDYFNLEATLEGMDLQPFNRILEPIAFVTVRKGKNKKLYLKVLANDDVALGSMFFEYDNLRISLISKNTYDTRGMGASIGSFFANTFIINRNNPRLIVLREGEIYFERDKTKSIFNYWAKIFFSGIVSSIGAKSNKKEIRKYERMEGETVLEK